MNTQIIDLKKRNYVNMISRSTKYTVNQLLYYAEKTFGIRPASVERGSCLPGINFEYVVTYWVCFE